MYTDIEGYEELRVSPGVFAYIRSLQQEKGLELSGCLFGMMDAFTRRGWMRVQSICIAYNAFSIFLHSTRKPAVIYKSGLVGWFVDGNPHRDILPAEIWPSGSMLHYNHGERVW